MTNSQICDESFLTITLAFPPMSKLISPIHMERPMADQKLSSVKPSINSSASIKIKPFMTSRNNPSVMMVTGMVKNNRMGLTKVLRIVSIKDVIMMTQ